MRCDYAFLCDYACDTGNGVSALGVGRDLLLAPAVPATHPHFFLVAQLRAGLKEMGTRPMAVRLIDDTGAELVGQNGEIRFDPPVIGSESVARLVLGFYMVQLPRYGNYFFTLQVEGTELARMPFVMLKPPAQG